jgi:small subunit ribosomal protein S2
MIRRLPTAAKLVARQSICARRLYTSEAAKPDVNGEPLKHDDLAPPQTGSVEFEFDRNNIQQYADLLRNRSMDETAAKIEMSPEMEKRLNEEFFGLLKEYILDRDNATEVLNLAAFEDETKYSLMDLVRALGRNDQGSDRAGNIQGKVAFPKVLRTGLEEAYTDQELYIRKLFHAGSIRSLGANVTDVYQPHKDVFAPPNIRQTSIATLMAAGCHLGHHTTLFRQNNQPFIHGIRDGIHIIDLESTLTHLRRAAKVVEGISEKGGVILFVGTRPGQEKALQLAAKRSGGYYVHSRWVPGTLTNATRIATAERVERDMGDNESGRELTERLKKTTIFPDMVVILNPVEQRPLINECISKRVPTIGIIDTDSEPTLVTYPIPCNDDSVRATDLITGILSRAAERGRKTRLNKFAKHKKAAESEAAAAAM